MNKRFKGLGWFKPLMLDRYFSRSIICWYMQHIAGGDVECHKRRASKMISEAKEYGEIVSDGDCKKNEYRFVKTKS